MAMTEHYKSPLKLTCTECGGDGSREPQYEGGSYPDIYLYCQKCQGLGYVTEFVEVNNPVSVEG